MKGLAKVLRTNTMGREGGRVGRSRKLWEDVCFFLAEELSEFLLSSKVYVVAPLKNVRHTAPTTSSATNSTTTSLSYRAVTLPVLPLSLVNLNNTAAATHRSRTIKQRGHLPDSHHTFSTTLLTACFLVDRGARVGRRRVGCQRSCCVVSGSAISGSVSCCHTKESNSFTATTSNEHYG